MANTSDLKKIEKVIKNNFLFEIKAKELKTKIKGIDPDIIAIKNDTLILGEITVSGFSGGKDGKGGHHTGGGRKISDSYAKLDYLRRTKNKWKGDIKEDFSKIEIYCVTIKGSKFVPAGWRKFLFSECDFIHKEISVDETTKKMIVDTLKNSKKEME